ncbi:MAG: phage minor head protein, partial [Candidatus Binataceae bacterium]
DPDANPRPQHLDWSGTVLRADDPWWETHWPPNGWNCKCEADSLGDKDLEKRGYQLRAAAPPSPTYTYVNPRNGEISEIPLGIDPGFAHNPGIAGIRHAADVELAEKLAAADTDIARAVEAIKSPPPIPPDPWQDAPKDLRAERRLAERLSSRRGEHAENETEAAFRALRPDGFQEISDYVKTSHPFNYQRRLGGPVTDKMLRLDDALQKLPKFNGRVYRGISMTPKAAADRVALWRSQGYVDDAAFISASRNAAAARKFGNRIFLRLESRTGAKIYPLTWRRQYRNEQEVLFRLNRRFRIVKFQEVKNKDGSRRWIIDAEEE